MFLIFHLSPHYYSRTMNEYRLMGYMRIVSSRFISTLIYSPATCEIRLSWPST